MKNLSYFLFFLSFLSCFPARAQRILDIRLGSGLGYMNWEVHVKPLGAPQLNTIADGKGAFIPLNADVLVKVGGFKIGAGVATNFNLIDSLNNPNGFIVNGLAKNLQSYYGQLEWLLSETENLQLGLNLQFGGFTRPWTENFKSDLRENWLINIGLMGAVGLNQNFSLFAKPTLEYMSRLEVMDDGTVRSNNLQGLLKLGVIFRPF